jgi:hypothetical protein
MQFIFRNLDRPPLRVERDVQAQVSIARLATLLFSSADIGRMHSSPTQISWSMLPAAFALVFAIVPMGYAASSSDASNSSSSVAPGQTLTGKARYYPHLLNGHEPPAATRSIKVVTVRRHNKLPLGTTAKVTNLKTGKSTDLNALSMTRTRRISEAERQRFSENMKRRWTDPEFRTAASERMKRQWQNEEFATKSPSASNERITRFNAARGSRRRLAAVQPDGVD